MNSHSILACECQYFRAARRALPTITYDDPAPYGGLRTETATWPEDPEAVGQFIRADGTCYVSGLACGTQLSGSFILAELRDRIASGLRIKVVGAACDVIGFFEKMVERGIIDEFTDQDIEAFFELDEENDFEEEDCYQRTDFRGP